MADYFAANRNQARKEGNLESFDWSSLRYSKDEVDYLKNRYDGKEMPTRNSTDWLDVLTRSHRTYTQVKDVFEGLGIDSKKVLNVENASKVLANPLVAESVYQKIEREFGIPETYSKDFAKKNATNLEDWAKFVEERMEDK